MCLGLLVDFLSLWENYSGVIYILKNDFKKIFCKDLIKREMCFKDGLFIISWSFDFISDKIDFGGVFLYIENGLLGIGLKFDIKMSSIDSSDKNFIL